METELKVIVMNFYYLNSIYDHVCGTIIVGYYRSEDYVVLEAPEFQPDPQGPGGENMTEQCSQGSGGSGVNGFTNVPECHYVMSIVSICQPRKHIYVIFILLVPVIILFGANL